MDELVRSLLKTRKQPTVQPAKFPWSRPERYSYAAIRAQIEREAQEAEEVQKQDDEMDDS
jgi:hypothetical protein